jgi:hypothetical protein
MDKDWNSLSALIRPFASNCNIINEIVYSGNLFFCLITVPCYVPVPCPLLRHVTFFQEFLFYVTSSETFQRRTKGSLLHNHNFGIPILLYAKLSIQQLLIV